MGRIMNCDIYISSNAYENVDAGADSTTDVYSALIIGGDSFGVAGVSSLEPKLIDSGGSEEYTMTGKNVPAELIVKGTDSGGAENLLNQRGSIGWKVTNDVQILNSNWIINLEHANMFSDD
jgi:N4-gp56 family major capsid protein